MGFDDLDDNAASRVQASLAVTRLVGAEALSRLRTEAFRRYTCCTCGQPGKTDAEPATVIVQRYRLGSVKVRLAHARCADSQIADVSADTPDPAALGGMLSKSAVLQYASGPRIRPLLILEQLARMTAGGEPMNLWMSGLLDRGFTMLRTGGEFPCLVRRARACVILIGAIGLNAYPGDEMTVLDLRRLLNRAARAGELAGAVVRAEPA